MAQLARCAAVLALAAAAGGCASTGRVGERVGARPSSAIVIEGEELEGRGSNLLRVIRSNTSAMQVRSGPRCPQIILRGQKSLLGLSSPSVYVDDQRAADTCILEMIDVHDVERVEVYPMGVSSRPGILSNGAGLILVFTRRAG